MEEVASQAGAKILDGALDGNMPAMIVFLIVAIGLPMWLLIIDRAWFHYSRYKQGIPREATMYKDAADLKRFVGFAA